MSDRIVPSKLSLASVCVLLGCQAMTGMEEPGADGPLEIGQNMLGEPCRVARSSGDPQLAGAQSAYQLFCGPWEQPSARIFQSSGGGDPMELATSSEWRAQIDALGNCEGPVATTILDGRAAAALDCAFRAGGWPFQAVVVQVGDNAYLADSIPSAYRTTEAAIALVAGLEPPTQPAEEMSRVRERLEAARYTAGDLEDYRNLLRLAQYHNFQGNYAEAEQIYREALALQTAALPGETGGRGFLLMHVALELSNQRRFTEAEALFERSGELLVESLEPTDEPRWFSYLAIHDANQGELDSAAENARRATELRLALADEYRTGPEVDAALEPAAGPGGPRAHQTVIQGRAETARGDIVQSRSVEAAMLIRAGELEEAEDALDDALSILRDERQVPRRWLPQIWFLQAQLAERRGDLTRAERLLLASIEEQHALSVNSRPEALAYLALGRVYAAQALTAEALQAYDAGFGIVATQGGGLEFDEALPFFETALAEAERQPEQRQKLFGKMFEVAQMVRGTVTAQTMARTAARLAASEQEVGQRIRDLQDARRRRDDIREALLLARSDPYSLPTDLAQIEQAERELQAQVVMLELDLQDAAPSYDQLVQSPVTIEEVSGVLLPGEALFQILVGTDGSIGFLVDESTVHAYRIDLGKEESEKIVQQIRDGLEISASHFDPALAYELYQRLLGRVEDDIKGVEHVITVPSGALLSLPLSTLVTDPPPGSVNYSQLDWLIRTHALTLAPSVQSFVNLRQIAQPSQATRPFVGFGDFIPHGDPEVILQALGLPETCRDKIEPVTVLPRLPNTADELRAVATSLDAPPDAIFLGAEFSEEAVKQAELPDYRIVYFATHGLLPHEVECLPAPSLLTSRPPGSSREADGLLTASDIVELELDADLVVLSACNTGGPGQQTGGESLSGLARAFFYAGARSLVVTHWQIPDEPTVELMTRMFAQMAEQRLTPAQALAVAQRQLLNMPRWSHPSNWAAFTLVGDGGSPLAGTQIAAVE